MMTTHHRRTHLGAAFVFLIILSFGGTFDAAGQAKNVALLGASAAAPASVPVGAEPYRPAYHFTPPANWMNDPNGLVYFDSEYHLFYQHNPTGTVWGPMHWGHAVSTDLVNWQHLPIALCPDDVGAIWSGSAVIDRNDTAGFGKAAMVAIFTHEKAGRQMQSLAYSTDRGRTWVKYGNNPVIEPLKNIKGFRDPKVFWYNEGGGAPAGGTGVQYFVGSFDGKTFISDNPKSTVLWADYGADFYAAQAWNDAPNGRHLLIGWMNNWNYAQQIPTSTWRGAMTLPRELALATTPGGIRLVQTPVPELQLLRDEHWSWRDRTVAPGTNLLADVTGVTLEFVAEFQAGANTTADRFGFHVRTGDNEQTTIGYTTKNPTLFVDRTRSGQIDFKPGFASIHVAEMRPVNDVVRLHIFVDRSSVEVFGNDGQVDFTEQIYPGDTSQRVELFAEGGDVRLTSVDVYQLRPAVFSKTGEVDSGARGSGWSLIVVVVLLAVVAGVVYLFIRLRRRG